jgi:hypothetical protein
LLIACHVAGNTLVKRLRVGCACEQQRGDHCDPSHDVVLLPGGPNDTGGDGNGAAPTSCS